MILTITILINPLSSPEVIEFSTVTHFDRSNLCFNIYILNSFKILFFTEPRSVTEKSNVNSTRFHCSMYKPAKTYLCCTNIQNYIYEEATRRWTDKYPTDQTEFFSSSKFSSVYYTLREFLLFFGVFIKHQKTDSKYYFEEYFALEAFRSQPNYDWVV